jgi:hypothetical protein
MILRTRNVRTPPVNTGEKQVSEEVVPAEVRELNNVARRRIPGPNVLVGFRIPPRSYPLLLRCLGPRQPLDPSHELCRLHLFDRSFRRLSAVFSSASTRRSRSAAVTTSVWTARMPASTSPSAGVICPSQIAAVMPPIASEICCSVWTGGRTSSIDRSFRGRTSRSRHKRNAARSPASAVPAPFS